MYVFFKNNCPCYGPLYDDFRICDIQTGEVILNCQLDCAWEKEKDGMPWHVFGGPRRQFDEPIAAFSDSCKMAKWLNEPWEVR